MVDDSTNLVTNLSTILPTYYEMIVDSSYSIPCITYCEGSNYADREGETIRYSRVQYEIKIWAKTKSDIVSYSSHVDTKMKSLGYTRTACRELVMDGYICKSFSYKGLALEN